MDDSTHDTARQDTPRYDRERQASDPTHFTMTVDDAASRFADAGLPRSVRSIQRYCQRGHLTCTTVDTEISEMYLIDPESVERRIQELQQIELITRTSGVSRHDAPSRDMSRHDATVRDTSRQGMSSEKVEQLEQRIRELENEKMQIEIDKRAKEFVINQLVEDRKNLFSQVSEHVRTITDQARVIGQLETRLELGPGRVTYQEPQRPRDDRAPVEPSRLEPEQPYRPFTAENRSPQHASPTIEYPPNYTSYPTGQGDNRPRSPDVGV